MADYPTLFSFEITDLTDDERAWLEALLAPDADRSNAELAKLLTDEGCVGFSAEFEDEGRTLWVFSEDSGTPEDAANVVQAFLARFRPGETAGFEWANTCSKPMVDAYGGGAVLITADEQRWMGSGNWLADQRAAGPSTGPAGGDLDQPVWSRPEGHYVVVCADESGRTWALARTLDGERDPFFFDHALAERIVAAINDTVAGTTATAAEWFAADTATGDDDFDVIVRTAHDKARAPHA